MNESLECTKNSFKAIEYCLERQILLNAKLMTLRRTPTGSALYIASKKYTIII